MDEYLVIEDDDCQRDWKFAGWGGPRWWTVFTILALALWVAVAAWVGLGLIPFAIGTLLLLALRQRDRFYLSD